MFFFCCVTECISFSSIFYFLSRWQVFDIWEYVSHRRGHHQGAGGYNAGGLGQHGSGGGKKGGGQC